MSKSVFIYCRDRETGDKLVNQGRIAFLFERSDQRHCISATPESADIILIADMFKKDWQDDKFIGQLVKQFPEKCFAVSEQDTPAFFIRGIYTSLEGSFFARGRVRSGSYQLFHSNYINPFVAHHEYSPTCEQKDYLFSFVGRRCHAVRHAILDQPYAREDILLEDTSLTFDLWAQDGADRKAAGQRSYAEKLLRSKFALCPRGAGTSSFRLFESMQLGVAPVIISDAWVVPEIPQWNSACIMVKEKHVGEIEKILTAHERDYAEMGAAARQIFSEHFSEQSYFNYLVESCEHLMATKTWIPEAYYWKLRSVIGAIDAGAANCTEKLTRARARIRLRSRLAQLRALIGA